MSVTIFAEINEFSDYSRVLDTHVLGIARSGAEVKVHLGHHADTAEGREAVVRADTSIETEGLAETAREAVDAATIVGVGTVVGALSSDEVGRSQGEDGVHAHLEGCVGLKLEQSLNE